MVTTLTEKILNNICMVAWNNVTENEISVSVGFNQIKYTEGLTES